MLFLRKTRPCRVTRRYTRYIFDNELELSNCFSINQLVEQNIISKNRTETSVKDKFSAIVSNLKIDFMASILLASGRLVLRVFVCRDLSRHKAL